MRPSQNFWTLPLIVSFLNTQSSHLLYCLRTKLFTKPAYMLVAFLYYNALNLSPKFSKCPVEHDPGTTCFFKASENFVLVFFFALCWVLLYGLIHTRPNIHNGQLLLVKVNYKFKTQVKWIWNEKIFSREKWEWSKKLLESAQLRIVESSINCKGYNWWVILAKVGNKWVMTFGRMWLDL